MLYVTLILSLVLPLTCWLFIRDRAREREFWHEFFAQVSKEHATILNRVQAPETAIAQSVMMEDLEKPAFTESDEIERFEREFMTDG